MKSLNSLKTWISGLLKDETGSPSSKRVVGIVCAATLCIVLYHNSFSENATAPASYLVDAVALLAFGCLGLSSIDKFTAIKKSVKAATEPEAPKVDTVDAKPVTEES